MSSKETSSPVCESVRFCAIRWPVFPLSWWNRTVFLLTAEYSFTGTFTSPKEIAPLHIERGMGPILLPAGPCRHIRTVACAPELADLRLSAGKVNALAALAQGPRTARALAEATAQHPSTLT